MLRYPVLMFYTIFLLTVSFNCYSFSFTLRSGNSPDRKIAIIKADDVAGPTQNWKTFLAISKERNVKVSCGIICNSLVDADEEYTRWLIDEEKAGMVEFWNHGWDHKQWETNGVACSEFRNSGYAHQKEHLTNAQEIMAQVLGRPTVSFGSPFNGFDEDTKQVIKENPDIKLFFCRVDPKIEGVISARMPISAEKDGTGRPNATKFAEDYEAICGQVGFLAIQFHPNKFPGDYEFGEYKKILDMLLNDGWTFLLPSEYVAMAEKGFGNLTSVLNHSFEDTHVTASGGYARYDQGAPGTNWSYSAPNAPTPAILLIDTEVYMLAAIPTGYDGTQVVSLAARKNTIDDYGTPNTIYQQVTGGSSGQGLLVAGQKLTLTVSLANLTSAAALKNFRVGLYADEALTQVFAESVSTTANPISLSTTAFEDFTLEWTVDEADAGKSIYIGFKVEQYGTSAGTARLGIDNVRLKITGQ